MRRWLSLCALCACTNNTELVAARILDAGSDARVEDGGTSQVEQPVRCGNVTCACSNGLDDDGDQLIDGFDPECTSAADNFEDSFATGAHGENQDKKCHDCFFDDDSGGPCKRARSCSLDGTSASGSGACTSCEVSSACADSCLPRVPNGCDCYGCCEIWKDGAIAAHVLLEESCTLANLDDTTACVRCTPAADCQNPCGTCELCMGRTPSDLPASCGSSFTCEGAQSCSSSTDCGGSYYCQQGCCMAIGI